MRASVILAVLLVVGSGHLVAQKKGSATPAPPPLPADPLFRARTLSCSFPVYATAEWPDGNPEVLRAPQDFAFKIGGIDTRRGVANIISATGGAEVTLIATKVGLNTVERTPIGNLVMTTVFAAGGPGNGTYLAVHSRHISDLQTAPTASQNYGRCHLDE